MIRQSLLNRANEDSIAVLEELGQPTFRELAQKAAVIQRRLPQAGNIALFLPNGGEYIAAFTAILMAGMAALPLNTQLTVHELAPLFAQASVAAVVTSHAFRALFDGVAEAVPVQVIYVEELPEGEPGALPVAVDTDADAPMVLLSTSGTTGHAKIVQLSERNVEASTFAYIDRMDFESWPREDTRVVFAAPFSSAYGLMVVTAWVHLGLPIITLKEPFSLDTLYKTAQRHRATHFEGGVSAALLMEQALGRPHPYDIGSFRYFGFAGSKVSASTLQKLAEAYPGVEFWPGYGMSEAGPLIAKPDKHVNLEKLDSAGLPIDCVTLRIDADGALTDAPHATGEILVQGPNVMLGYYGNEEATREILRDGYLHTGDIGYLDEEGYLYICGRKKNIIIVRGFNVHAEEVEACILRSGLARDCVVYGETDALGNETVCADVVPLEAAARLDDLRAYCVEHLAAYKQPHKVRWVDAIRKTASGKTERGARNGQ